MSGSLPVRRGDALPGLPACASGRHTWTDPRDAERCCNGWRRQLVVARPALGEKLPPDARAVSALPGARGGFVWVPDEPAETR